MHRTRPFRLCAGVAAVLLLCLGAAPANAQQPFSLPESLSWRVPDTLDRLDAPGWLARGADSLQRAWARRRAEAAAAVDPGILRFVDPDPLTIRCLRPPEAVDPAIFPDRETSPAPPPSECEPMPDASPEARALQLGAPDAEG